MAQDKRVNYFQGMMLVDQDFKDDQNYHRQMRHHHNLELHTWGVVRGLEVSLVAGQVQVSEGIAIDANGKEIWWTGGAPALGNALPSGENYLIIEGSEELRDEYPQLHGKYLRVLDTAKFSWKSAPGANDLALARLSTGALDNSVRRTASSLRAYGTGDLEIRPASKDGALRLMTGAPLKERVNIDASGKLEIKGSVEGANVKFGGKNGDAHHLSSARNFVFNSEFGEFFFRKTTYADLASYADLMTLTESALLVKGNISVGGKVGVGAPVPDHALTIQGKDAAYLNVKVTDGPVEVLVGADKNSGVVSTKSDHDLQLRAGKGVTRMTIRANGKVGIGTTTPNSELVIF